MNVPGRRLRSLRLEGRPLARTVDVVRWLVASQAQDFAGAKWALGLRMRSATDAAVERAFDEGAILRTHVLRPTWHFVTPDDIRWLLALTGPRVHAVNASRYRDLGLDAATLRRTDVLLARALAGGRTLTRDELRAALRRARVAADGQRMAYILMHAELEAVVCSGPRRGRQFTYALLDERAPGARRLSREEALVELASRYFRSRGPATARDFAKWSGLLLADARRGLEQAALRREVIGAETHGSAPGGPAGPARPPRAHLLSIYDEYISSYRDRSAIGDPADAPRLVGLGNALAYVFLLEGRIAGTWRRALTRRSVEVRVAPFRRLNVRETKAVAAAAERYANFLGEGRGLDLAFA